MNKQDTKKVDELFDIIYDTGDELADLLDADNLNININFFIFTNEIGPHQGLEWKIMDDKGNRIIHFKRSTVMFDQPISLTPLSLSKVQTIVEAQQRLILCKEYGR